MKKIAATIVATAVAMTLHPLAGTAVADEVRGIAFAHDDWELACDNTRTCRAAGNHPRPDDDGDDGEGDGEVPEKPLPVSVLLTRKAGPNEPVTGELHIGHYGEETTATFPPKRSLTMLVDGTPVGRVALAQGRWIAALAPGQTDALLRALLRDGKIAWTDGKRTWRLSTGGAATVMRKMDAFQRRSGTRGALADKGAKDERDVLPAVPAPAVTVPDLPANGYLELPPSTEAALRKALAASSGDECPLLAEPGGEPHAIFVHRLSGGKLLAFTTCWMGASGTGESYWVINAAPPFAPQFVTALGKDYANGKIDASQRGSGYDCAETEEWTWNGKRFVRTRMGTTGMCREIDMGGAWWLPVLVTDVRRAPAGSSGERR